MDIRSLDKITFDMIYSILGVRNQLQNFVENLDQEDLDKLAVEIEKYDNMCGEYKVRLAELIKSIINQEEDSAVRGEVNENGVRIN